MVDETGSDTDAPERMEDLVEEATDLIGTEELWRGQILHTGAELGLFEALDDGPASATDLAADLDLDADGTYRLLRAMEHFGVIEGTANEDGGDDEDEDEDRLFSLARVGELFLADHPRSVRRELLFNRSPEWIRAMLHMPDVVSEGGPPGFVREFGSGFFEYVQEDPEFGERYNGLIELASRDHPDRILDALDAYDFSRFSEVCDVGGGRGRLLCHLLKANPHLRGTVLELPGVVAEEDRLWASKLGVADRCRYVTGDMFEGVPRADAYVLKWILHNFDDEECRRILSTVHESAPPDGRLFVVEAVVPDPETSHFAKRRDVTMMVQVGGRERTRDEYVSLLNRTGWEFVEAWVPEEGPLSVLEAVKE